MARLMFYAKAEFQVGAKGRIKADVGKAVSSARFPCGSHLNGPPSTAAAAAADAAADAAAAAAAAAAADAAATLLRFNVGRKNVDPRALRKNLPRFLSKTMFQSWKSRQTLRCAISSASFLRSSRNGNTMLETRGCEANTKF